MESLNLGLNLGSEAGRKQKSESVCYAMEAEKSVTNHNDKILSQRQRLSQKCSVIPCSELTPQFVSLTFCCCFYC